VKFLTVMINKLPPMRTRLEAKELYIIFFS
jgi:hypothetical protein